MPVTEKNSIEEIEAARDIAETILDSAKRPADLLRVMHAKAVLRQAFPQHAVAVFARYWDQDEPRLIQLISAEDDVEDVELQDDDVATALTGDQKRAASVADRAIRLLGSDDEVWNYLDAPDEEHEDWYEFDLTLAELPDETETAD
ncbi:hypothetical protein [Cryobacterium zhongshanensis]|uniref:Uncharacterized protein n=1 Tax=Cryobacterium zhongshanensis TaxID=2928153 RepID=A0AA41UIM4_9MICO|nr:hypothetical protein [Cryobacterium zhongshanensis]MCI4659694.1 hypothetical protein [Cryobacterium zhongshanensis]